MSSDVDSFDVSKVIFVVLGISKLFGVYPIGRNVSWSLMMSLSIVIQALRIGYECYLWVLDPGESPWVPTSIGWYYTLFHYTPLMMALVSNFVSLFIFRGYLAKIFDDLHCINRGIASVSRSEIEYSNARRENKILPLLILIDMFNIFSSTRLAADGLNLVAEVMNKVALVAVQCQFTGVVHILEDQVLALVKVLNGRSQPIKDAELEKILRLFNRIHNSCSALNAVYSVQILAITTLVYININVNAYRLVMFFYWVFDDNETHQESLSVLLVNVVGFFQSTTVLLILVEACSSLQSAVVHSKKSLYRLILDGENQELQFNEYLMAHFNVNQIPRFSVCGFFYLNYEMMYSVCASNVMFIVLALQMF